jgi:hypothetical protein
MQPSDVKQAWRTDGFDIVSLFGFPPPGHPFWTAEALAGTALRYPRLDLTPWEGGGL